MGNIGATFKRFLSNKNTVTILGVLAGLAVLIVGYNWRVNHAVETINIPYAKKTITATGAIAADNIGFVKVLNETVKNNKNIITDRNSLISANTNYCVTYGTSVPEGAFFYREQVVNCQTMPNDPFKNMPDGYKPVELSVDIHSTYGNSMYPGDYIDLYVKMESSDNKVIFGKFISKIQIADVRDSRGNSVFLTSTASEPSSLLFTVKEEYFLLLRKAIYSKKVELVPVPGNASYTSNPGDMAVESEYLRQQILNYTSDIPDEVVQ